ncbi:hypothetical protein ACQ4LE_006762 [Meloidogyne hapla]
MNQNNITTNNSTYYSNNILNFNNVIEEERFLNFNNSLNNYEFNNKNKFKEPIKQEEELNNLLLEQQQNNGFNQQSNNLIDVNASSSSVGNPSGDFFSPLHQLLMPSSHQQHLHNPGEPSGSSSSYFADTTASSAPADPRPSASIAERRQHYKANNHHSSSSSTSSTSRPSTDRKRPYPCSLCSSRFGSKMELEEHQNSHTGQKPFQCDVCQSRFNRRSTLWNHKRIHSDAKPFICTVCHMQFKWKNSLKCHKEMHLRKNELQASSFPELDATHMLTYATAAKKKMGELTGKDPSTITLLPTTSNNSSRFLTCAGTPRKRAPPRTQKNFKIQKTFEENISTPPTTSSFSLPFLPSSSSQTSSNFSQQFLGKEIKNDENKLNNSEQILENNLLLESSLLRPQPLTTTINNELIISNQIITENNKQINNSTTTNNTGLDIFRFGIGLNNHQNNNSEQLLLLQQQQNQQQQQQFISPQHLQLISPTTNNNYSNNNQQQQLIVQQNFPLDLLACCNNNGGNTSSILDFNLNNNNNFEQNNNFLGFDLNSIATNDSNNLISNINSSNGVIDQFNIPNQNSFGNTLTNTSVATTVLNNYQFDSASVRFLAAAAEISSAQQQQTNNLNNTDIQQRQQQILIPTNSINYGGMFCSPTNNNTINIAVSSISNNYNNNLQHYNNTIQDQQCGSGEQLNNEQKNLFDNSSLFNSNLNGNQQQQHFINVEETKQKQQTPCSAVTEEGSITAVSYC